MRLTATYIYRVRKGGINPHFPVLFLRQSRIPNCCHDLQDFGESRFQSGVQIPSTSEILRFPESRIIIRSNSGSRGYPSRACTQLTAQVLKFTTFSPILPQGVLRVRKRVTLMVITVSVIFGVCWLADTISFILTSFSSHYASSDMSYIATSTLILFNSAINPIVYALVNQKFRAKIKLTVSCPCSVTPTAINGRSSRA